MRTIFCLQQGRDKPTEAYNRRFESSISTAELSKSTPTMYMEINKTHAGGNNNNVTKRFQDMCLLVSAESKWF